jgi:hypothetical protein
MKELNTESRTKDKKKPADKRGALAESGGPLFRLRADTMKGKRQPVTAFPLLVYTKAAATDAAFSQEKTHFAEPGCTE